MSSTESEFETCTHVGERIIRTVGLKFAKSELGEEWFEKIFAALRDGHLVIIRSKEYGFARGLEIRETVS